MCALVFHLLAEAEVKEEPEVPDLRQEAVSLRGR
tara:strand:- start:197 stop:298 length:102 start_codon:yes stop_codon:yes gene_type:complete